MKTLTSTLTTAQQQSAIQPSVTATLTSNGWPAFAAHAVRIAPTNRDGDAVSTGTAIIRICNDLGTIRFMRITDPDTATNFYQWTALVSGVGSSTQVCIFRALGRVVVAWPQSNDIKWMYSDDDGLTWSGTNSAAYEAPATVSTTVAIGGISSAVTGRGAIVIAYDQDGAPDTYHLLLWKYNEGTNTWSSIGDYGGSEVSGEPDSVAGVYRTDSDDYCVALLIAFDPAVTSLVRPIVLFHATASAWMTADTQTHSKLTTTVYDASNRVFIQMSQTKINGFYWLSFTQVYHDTGAVVVFLARSDDGLFYSAYGAAEIRAVQEKHVRMLQHGDYVYLIKPAEVWRSPLPAADVADLTVVRYEFDGERITITLHDGDGDLAGSALLVEGGLIRVERGAGSVIGVERVELHQFSIISVDIDGAVITVKAETLLERMKRWVSEYSLTWTGTLANLLERLAAWCDIQVVSVDSASVWDNTLTGFTVSAGQRGNQVLARLQDYYPFLVEMDGSTLRATVAVAAPASTYDFDEHAGTIALRTGFELTANQVFVYGLAPSLYQAFAYAPASYARALHLTDRFLTSTALAQARANAEILVQKERRRVGRLETLPHFGVQVGDVVTADGENWRITQIAEKYRKPHGLKQVLTLRGTT